MNLIGKLKDKNNWGKIIVSIVLLICVAVVVNQYIKQKEISEFKESTVGKIVKFEFINMKRYFIEYEFYLNDKKYSGTTEVSYFKCNNGREGCVDETFTVYYSSKNPSYSKIDLGKYEKCKTTVEFFD